MGQEGEFSWTEHVYRKKAAESRPSRLGPAAILAVLLAAYLGLCGWVSASDTILPNVTAAGLDLSGHDPG